MGGPGSGNWWRWQGKKTTVEESLSLSVKDLRKRLYQGAAGTITWTRAGGKSQVGYFVMVDDDALVVTLHYRWRETENVAVPVRLETAPTRFGGRRWWFTCPLCSNGTPCNRRAGKLYLPPGARYFGCRLCHNLTYRSSQEAHQAERVFGRLGVDPESARLLGSHWNRRFR
jgi:hypothetical protein